MATRKGHRVLDHANTLMKCSDKIASIGAHSARIGGTPHEEIPNPYLFASPDWTRRSL